MKTLLMVASLLVCVTCVAGCNAVGGLQVGSAEQPFVDMAQAATPVSHVETVSAPKGFESLPVYSESELESESDHVAFTRIWGDDSQAVDMFILAFEQGKLHLSPEGRRDVETIILPRFKYASYQAWVRGGKPADGLKALDVILPAMTRFSEQWKSDVADICLRHLSA